MFVITENIMKSPVYVLFASTFQTQRGCIT